MFYGPNFDVDTYRASLGRVGSWVGDCEMCLVAILFGVNITSFACVKDANNVNKAVSVFSTATTLSSMNLRKTLHQPAMGVIESFLRACTQVRPVRQDRQSEDRLDALNPPTATPCATTTKSKNRLEAWNPVDDMLTGIAGAMSSTASTVPAIRSAETTKASTADVDQLVAMDETFIMFHMTNKMLLVPTGTKQVGSVNPIDDEKKGVTLAVACEKSVVVFNATHWMTQYIFTIFLAWLKTLFKGDKI
ncbi:hypothetical protein H257_19412, partial [Aphanomyces astaci]